MILRNKLSVIAIFFVLSTFTPFIVSAADLGNPLYSRQNIESSSNIEGGLYGSRDYFTENIFIKYTFRSETRHLFTLIACEESFLPGIFSDNLAKIGPSIYGGSGFEYSIKLLPPKGLLSFNFITGIGPETFFLSTSVGFGERMSNGAFVTFNYLYNSYFSSDVDLYFQIVKYFSLKINMGVFVDYKSYNKEPVIKTGLFPGFYIANYFRLNMGGGFTVNEYYAFGFYVSAFTSVKIPF